jgi:hypothetical protein
VVESDKAIGSKGDVKRRFYLPHEELLDEVEEEAEQFDLPCPNLATEDTYSDGGEDDVRGRREDGVGEVVTAKRFVTGVVEG